MRRGFTRRFAVAALLALAIVSGSLLAGMPGRAAGDEGATLYLTPDAGQYIGAGVTFDVQIRLKTGDDPINAVQAYLTFPTDKLEVVGLPATAGSFLQYWMPEAAVDPGAGTIHLAAGVPGGGFAGGFSGDDVVETVTFRTKAVVGTATVAFDSANCFVMRSSDSTNVLSKRTPASYTITDHTSASLHMTGALRVSGQRLEAGYELLADSIRIPLTTASIQSITCNSPGGGSGTVVPDDASGNLWADVQQPSGTYTYTVLMQPSEGLAISYAAALDWNPQTVVFGAGGTWSKQSGCMYIPYSCGLDLSTATAIAHFDNSEANPVCDVVPATADLLFPIACPGGQYRFVVIRGGTLTFALLTQPRTGDLNHDGIINIADLSMLLPSWGPARFDTEADINMDLTVSIIDLSALLSRWTRLN